MTMPDICIRRHRHQCGAHSSRGWTAARWQGAAKLTLWAWALVLAGAGCSSQSPRESTTSAPQGAVELAPEALQGHWRKACGPVARGQGEPALFDIVELRITGADLHTHIRTFSDAACQTPYKYAANVTAYTRLLPGAVIAGVNAEQVRAVDLAAQPYSGADFQPREFLAFALIDGRLYWSLEEPGRDGLSAQRRALRLDFARPFERF